MQDHIFVKGARVHNLKNIDVKIPRDKLVVLTGLSGSGKSSLAFDTVFAEGQRRYMESLSSYARQFLGQMDKPDVDYIDGLSPAISIDQKTTSHNPRSTVGTVTEIYDYLRLLYANIGVPHCPECGKEISQQTVDQIADKILAYPEGSKVMVIAPVVRGRKGEFQKLIDGFRKSGYLRVRVDGADYTLDTDDEIDLDKQKKHTISVVVDRLIVKEGINRRLSDSLEAALRLADGLVAADVDGETVLFSTKFSCPDCDVSIEEIAPRLFSFNSPYGACPHCHGLGFTNDIDLDKVVKDWNKSINEGALDITGWSFDSGKIARGMYQALARNYKFSLDTPVKNLPENVKRILFYGTDEKIKMKYDSGVFSGSFYKNYEGIVNNLLRRYDESNSDFVKHDIERFMKYVPCESCRGLRLKNEALAVTVGGMNIARFCALPIDEAYAFIDRLELSERDKIVSAQIVKEIKARLKFLTDVGLSYLTLSRSSATLSGGESQRIRLATQIGSGLMGVLYILDEPSIGLHQKDNSRLLGTLKNLRDMGNTLIVVEHDEETMENADWIIDIGPGAGVNGGELVAEGTPDDIKACERSVTGRFLSGKEVIDTPFERRSGNGKFLTIKNARQNNLKNVDVEIPLGAFTAITGVSGSGKSSLVNEVLYPVLQAELNGARRYFTGCDRIEGVENLDKVIAIDQAPIGRTPRSNPATYTGVFTAIRELFSKTPEAQARGYKSGRFSFNVAGGRCENCSGDGIIKIEMHFLSDVYVPCEVCGGRRYNRETLEVKYKGKSIHDVLEMTVGEACGFFENLPQIYNKIKTLDDVGLSYIKLGQSATTLSGGEAQRVKLATELSKRSTGKTVYILDEPTTGLHTADVKKLITILQRFVNAGNTVIVIEHNLDVIKVADHVVDLGPEGGDKGGRIVAQGTPEQVAAVKGSYTGEELVKKLKKI